ncbi:U-box domain-containing protein 3-like isoform X2 [Aristolochia californica]|uniref:U-box domain-containing protein 3-like isoform X2 n=1 Tax=Aristolochia californica TaxID=171875 RepID=UPI0035DA1C7D
MVMRGDQAVFDLTRAGLGFHQHPSTATNLSEDSGVMGIKTFGGLINSISRFIHLVACQDMKSFPVQKDYRDIVSALKLLKPLLHDVATSNMTSDESLVREFEELDLAVNKAREFMERWGPKMSRICTVLQCTPFVEKVQRSSLQICYALTRLLPPISCASHLTCIQELKCLDQEERLSEFIEEALRDQRENLIPETNLLLKIAESLSLTSNQELLSESIALEKEILKSELKKNNGEVSHINKIIDLVSHIRMGIVKLEHFQTVNGIVIPSYFRCPLSLKLMEDPVIVASGQTYERVFIQKWLDQGLRICPKSRQTLSHTNLIPNYTVKALITSWCEDHNIRWVRSVGSHDNFSQVVSEEAADGLSHVDSCRGSLQSDVTSRISVEVGHVVESQGVAVSSRNSEQGSNLVEKGLFEGTPQNAVVNEVTSEREPSFERSCNHSWCESVSSVISTTEDFVSRESSKHDNIHEASEEATSGCTASYSDKDSSFSRLLSMNQNHNRKARTPAENGKKNGIFNRNISSLSDLGFDDVTTYAHAQKLVEDLTSHSNEAQTAAAAEMRLLAKHNMENRIILAKCGAIGPLVSLLCSEITQENAVTALLNLSINDNNKTAIAEAEAIDPLIHVLKSGGPEAKENAAATLFSLSVLEEYKIRIGRSGAVKALVDLLGSGTLRGKKDAATALFNLSIFHENKARIVQAGAVKYLVELIDPAKGMTDKALALLANLATVSEGRTAITREGGIPLLVEVVDMGSQRGQENAASALLQLCINSKKFCTLVLQEGAVPPLVALSQSGTPRAREKAQQILSHFRNQREGITGKTKSS